MAQRKGHTGNPNGRPKGSPNKITQDMRAWLSGLLDNNRSQIERDLAALEPKERLMILEKFMQYTLPKVQSIEQELNLNTLAALSEEQVNAIVEDIVTALPVNEIG